MAINATNPVSAPAVPAITYDQWFMTQLVGRFNTTAAPMTITLQRSATVNGATVLAPNTAQDNSITFTLDAWKEMANDPAIATAIQAVLAAVTTYASNKHLL